MRKFMTICVAVVLCLAALTVFASAANTNCVATGTANHDWTAWKTVQLNLKLYILLKDSLTLILAI